MSWLGSRRNSRTEGKCFNLGSHELNPSSPGTAADHGAGLVMAHSGHKFWLYRLVNHGRSLEPVIASSGVCTCELSQVLDTLFTLQLNYDAHSRK